MRVSHLSHVPVRRKRWSSKPCVRPGRRLSRPSRCATSAALHYTALHCTALHCIAALARQLAQHPSCPPPHPPQSCRGGKDRRHPWRPRRAWREGDAWAGEGASGVAEAGCVPSWGEGARQGEVGRGRECEWWEAPAVLHGLQGGHPSGTAGCTAAPAPPVQRNPVPRPPPPTAARSRRDALSPSLPAACRRPSPHPHRDHNVGFGGLGLPGVAAVRQGGNYLLGTCSSGGTTWWVSRRLLAALGGPCVATPTQAITGWKLQQARRKQCGDRPLAPGGASAAQASVSPGFPRLEACSNTATHLQRQKRNGVWPYLLRGPCPARPLWHCHQRAPRPACTSRCAPPACRHCSALPGGASRWGPSPRWWRSAA